MKSIKNQESIFLLSTQEKNKYYLISYSLIFFLILLFYKSLILSFVCAFSCVWGLAHYEKHAIERKKVIVMKEFGEALYSISASFEMGKNLVGALEEAEKTLYAIYKEGSLLGKEIKKMRLEIINSNQQEEKALISFFHRVPLEDVKNFVDIYIFCKKTGGNLIKVINNSSQIITEKISLEREINALMYQKKFEGKIILSMPIATLIFLNMFSPEYLELLYNSLQGRMVMTASLAGIVIGFLLMNKLTSIKI